jgi:hypothetical protein
VRIGREQHVVDEDAAAAVALETGAARQVVPRTHARGQKVRLDRWTLHESEPHAVGARRDVHQRARAAHVDPPRAHGRLPP